MRRRTTCTRARSFVLCCLPALGVLAASPPSARAQATDPPLPDPRAHHQLVYHGDRETAYLIGGSTPRGDGYHYFDGIWAWDGERWSPVGSLPFPRSSHRVVYHRRRSSLVLFGGGFGRAVRAEGVVWEGRGGEWKARGGSFEAGRNEPGMCYDRARGRVVIFGGWDAASTFRGETLAWDGGEDLVELDSGGPAPRSGHAFVYDPVRERCLLFGGRGDDGFLADTWEWDGGSWRRVDVEGPTPRWFFGAATDPEHDRIVVFGGAGPDGDLADTWTWDGDVWRRLEAEGPPARSMAKLAFTGDAVVLFGGRRATEEGVSDLNDTWELEGDTWVRR